jgi:hypothetical protein
VRLGEEHSTLRETIEIRGDGLGMALETAQPIVEIVNGDEEDVGALRSGGQERKATSENEEKPKK